MVSQLYAVRSRGGFVWMGCDGRRAWIEVPEEIASWVTTDSPGQERTSFVTELMSHGMAWPASPGHYFGGTGVWTRPGCRGSSATPRSDVGRDQQQNSGWGGGLYHTMCRVGATPCFPFLQRSTFCEHDDKAGPVGRCCRFTTPRARLARVPMVLSVCGWPSRC